MPASARRHLLTKALFCLAALAAVGWWDYRLGDVNVSPLYFLLVAYTAWQFNSLTAGATASVIAAFCRFMADDYRRLGDSVDWVAYENAAMRLIIFLATAYAFISYRRTLEAHRRRIEILRRMLPVCHSCGGVRGPDGQWLPFDRFSRSPFPEVVECPDCADNTGKPRE